MIPNVYINVVSIYAVVEIVSMTVIVNQFHIKKIYDTPYGETLGTSVLSSFSKCLAKCSKKEDCRSVSFDDTSQQCEANRYFADTASICGAPTACSNPDALMYGEKYLETTMRLACRSDADCVDVKSSCILDKCQCDPGYSYNRSACACVSSCSQYGVTFQADVGRRIQAFNNEVLQPVSLEECQSSCANTTTFVCRTVEYLESKQRCHLQVNTALDVPDGFYVTDALRTLYTRDCE